MLRRLYLAAVVCFVPMVCALSSAQRLPATSNRSENPTSPYAGNLANDMQSRVPAVLTGRVVGEDREPVAEATVVLDCGGVARGTAKVKVQGHFALVVDVQPGGSKVASLIGCEVRASASGFQSERHPIRSLHERETYDVGSLILHPLATGGDLMVSTNSLLAPPEARRLLSRGMSSSAAGKWAQAEELLQHAIEIYPRYAEAWHELGLAFQKQGKADEARRAFQEAVSADGAFLRPYYGLVGVAADAKNWEEMRSVSESALAFTSEPLMLFYNGIAKFNLRQFDEAEKSLLRAEQSDTQRHLPQIELLLGDVLIERRDFAAAATRVRQYLSLSPDGPQAEAARAELARLEQLSGR